MHVGCGICVCSSTQEQLAALPQLELQSIHRTGAHLYHSLVHELIPSEAWAYDDHSESLHPVTHSADCPVNSLFLGLLALLKLQDSMHTSVPSARAPEVLSETGCCALPPHHINKCLYQHAQIGPSIALRMLPYHRQTLLSQ